jgi:thimet oligopeptidase
MLYDYTSVTEQSVGAVVEDAITRGEELIAGLVAGPASWDNTMAPLNEIAALVVQAIGQGPFMARVHPDKAVRDAAQRAEERITKWYSDLVFRRDLYEAVESFAATPEAAALEGEPARLLEFVRRDLRRAGHALAEEPRSRLQRLRARLVELGVAFTRNIDEFSDGLDLTRDDLDGLPDDYVARLRPGAAPSTFRVSLDYPEYYPFMDLAHRRDLREQLQYKSWNKARQDNLPLLEETLQVRLDMARLLGLPSWAHHAMEERMAKDPETVESFYEQLIPPLQAKAADELDDLRAALGHDDVQSWDLRYLHTKIKRERFGIDPDEVAAYFPLEQVFEGMFQITGEVFGLTYRQIDNPAVWHPDVTTYEILDGDSGERLATFFADMFPREGKFGHAAAFDIYPGHEADDGYRRPVTAIVANLTKPTSDSPSLLKHEEVVTLFHEFGHVLHNSLGQTRLVRFTGFNTEWDFVEAPSQIMEHWCWKPEVLRRFARHHRTGELIPEDLVQRLADARDLQIALLTLRQISFGLLDMAFHDSEESKDLFDITRRTTEVSAFPYHEGTFFAAGFGHLFGYDAGYYGYLWSKVFGDDMFSRFEKDGVLNPQVGGAYRAKILEQGGSRDASDMLRDFLGREPNKDAFLTHLGIA